MVMVKYEEWEEGWVRRWYRERGIRTDGEKEEGAFREKGGEEEEEEKRE